MSLSETRVARVEDTLLTVGALFVDDLAPPEGLRQALLRHRVAGGGQHGVATIETHVDLPSLPERVH